METAIADCFITTIPDQEVREKAEHLSCTLVPECQHDSQATSICRMRSQQQQPSCLFQERFNISLPIVFSMHFMLSSRNEVWICVNHGFTSKSLKLKLHAPANLCVILLVKPCLVFEPWLLSLECMLDFARSNLAWSLKHDCQVQKGQ